MKAILVALAMLLSAGLEVALAADVIDPALVATWKLEWQRADLFWAIRSDGVYRLHGPGATARQLGKIEAKQGRFSMNAPLWADSGTYKLSNADTVERTGGDQMGRLQFLRRDAWVTIGEGLNPQATMDDLPSLVELARAADRRLGGFALPGPSDASQKRMEEFEKAKAGGWKGRLAPGQSIPPQKGPQPFQGW